jgi:hypothetical protein
MAVIKPLDDQGLRKDRPSDEAKWTRLDNCLFQSGALDQRPAARLVGPHQLAAVIDRAMPNAIVEHVAEKETLVNELLFPNADGFYTQWSVIPGGTRASVLDEPTLDESDFVHSSTNGQKFSVQFSNLTDTYDEISRLVLWFASQNFIQLVEGTETVLKIYVRRGTTDYLIEEVVVREASEELLPEMLVVVMPVDPATGKKWQPAVVDTLEVVWELVSRHVIERPTVFPQADGTEDEWTGPYTSLAAAHSS